MVRIHFAPLAALILLAATVAAQPAFEALDENELARLDREAGLAYDLDFLVAETQARHADPERPAYSPAFLDYAESLRASFPELSDLDVMVGFMRLLAILDDGHTTIYGPGRDSRLEIDGGTLPVKFYAFEEGVYIADGLGGAAEYAGSRVISIGSMEVASILDELAELRGGENEHTWLWMGPQFYLPQIAMLRAVAAVGPEGAASLTLEAPDGEVRVVELAAGNSAPPRKLRSSPALRGPVPDYLSRVDDNFWMQPLPAKDALYLQFNQVRDSEDMSLAELAEQLRLRLRETGARHLIIDVRHNNGGNNRLLRPLLQTLIAFEQEDEGHRIYLISGRNTFSAAQNFINRLERWTDAIFVGEPSASSPNFVGEETSLELPWTGLVGSLSDHYWQDSDPGDEREFIAMDIAVPVTAADYFAGRDAALEAVLRDIDGRRPDDSR